VRPALQRFLEEYYDETDLCFFLRAREAVGASLQCSLRRGAPRSQRTRPTAQGGVRALS
jgi:hypothetical protein